jgi:4-aminobutyrate aminotransferase-like enzyme
MERERLNEHVLKNEAALGATLGKLLDLPIVGDVRGDGYFWAVELVKDKPPWPPFDTPTRAAGPRVPARRAVRQRPYCRPDDRGDVVIQVAHR